MMRLKQLAQLLGISLLLTPMPSFADQAHDAERSGDPESQYQLGMKYRYGLGVKKDESRAVDLFESAATQGHSKAQKSLGDMHMNGRGGLIKNSNKAVIWYSQAAKKGNAEAQTKLGNIYLKGAHYTPSDEKKALKYYQAAAEQGHDKAQGKLGYMHEHGIGTPRNQSKAVEWLTKSANQGNAKAQTLLADIHANGEDKHKDPKKALELYEKAAAQGHAPAQNRLGIIHSHGHLGIEKNQNKATEHFKKAAAQRHPEAQYHLANQYLSHPPQGTQPDATTDLKRKKQALLLLHDSKAGGYTDSEKKYEDLKKEMKDHEKNAQKANSRKERLKRYGSELISRGVKKMSIRNLSLPTMKRSRSSPN